MLLRPHVFFHPIYMLPLFFRPSQSQLRYGRTTKALVPFPITADDIICIARRVQQHFHRRLASECVYPRYKALSTVLVFREVKTQYGEANPYTTGVTGVLDSQRLSHQRLCESKSKLLCPRVRGIP